MIVNREKIPLWEKPNLIIEEAAALYNIGEHKLRKLTDSDACVTEDGVVVNFYYPQIFEGNWTIGRMDAISRDYGNSICC